MNNGLTQWTFLFERKNGLENRRIILEAIDKFLESSSSEILIKPLGVCALIGYKTGTEKWTVTTRIETIKRIKPNELAAHSLNIDAASAEDIDRLFEAGHIRTISDLDVFVVMAEDKSEYVVPRYEMGKSLRNMLRDLRRDKLVSSPGHYYDAWIIERNPNCL